MRGPHIFPFARLLNLRTVLAAVLFCFPFAEIRAEEPPLPNPVEFSRDVLPALTKLGCNGGACHGAFSGRGGFRLSLWGFDPAADYASLVSEARGRRVFPAAPVNSLILQKGTMALPHGGGRRLNVDSESYRIILAWMKQGAKGPENDPPGPTRLEITPAALSLKSGEGALLKVHAIDEHGHKRDVTRWALFASTSDVTAEVDDAGSLKADSPGRAALTVSYRGLVAAVPVTVPYGPSTTHAEFQGPNFIDPLIAAEWTKLGYEPAALADDATFLRRVSLDLIGTLPTDEEAREFLASDDSDKRGKLIDHLLERPEYADYWSLKWGDLLRIHRRSLGEKGLANFQGWLRQSLRENRPFDAIARDLITAQGNLYTSGPVAYYFIDQTPQDLAETTAQVFLGIRMQCARCHHHPFEVWSQDDYYGLAAFFARINRKDTKEGGRYGGAQSVQWGGTGTVKHPATDAVMQPRVLGEDPIVVQPDQDERLVLADWMTAADNPFFARNIVNRYWGALFGRGLVDPIDDFRATNPASHPELLDRLAADFVESGYDVKRLLRTICTSRTYQLAAEIAPERDIDGAFFTHRVPRRMGAEVLLDALNHVTGTSEQFDSFPVGTRAISLPDPAVNSYFLETFGRPNRTSTCECARSPRSDLRQVLQLANSESLQEKLASKSGRINKLVEAGKSDAEIVSTFFHAALSRPPDDAELQRALAGIAAAGSRQEGLEDLLWAILNLPEFSHNH